MHLPGVNTQYHATAKNGRGPALPGVIFLPNTAFVRTTPETGDGRRVRIPVN